MPYTSHGYMTPADLADTRRSMDLDLCGCCEQAECAPASADDPTCRECGHPAADDRPPDPARP